VSVRLYTDVHVRRAVTEGLRLRGVDVLSAQEDGAAEFLDPELLTRAAARERLLFTQDEDLLAEAARRRELGEAFGGLVYAHQLNVTIRVLIEDLELIAGATNLEEWANTVVYLPLR
jgi:predicted nuclease of predicted toxin-antitoxin system